MLRNMANNKSSTARIWALIPAAGIGARMAADCPKQYLTVQGKTILEHSLSIFLGTDKIAGVQLCLSPEDAYWQQLGFSHKKLLSTCAGGERRADSVLSGLQALEKVADAKDWVLVHDAARPCLTQELLMKLIDSVAGHSVGGILAAPVADTLKNASQEQIENTVDRSNLWAAQTPQMFRLGFLTDCLQKALANGVVVTDEASCVEAAGFQPQLVPSVRSNIKVTYPEDLAWVDCFLASTL